MATTASTPDGRPALALIVWPPGAEPRLPAGAGEHVRALGVDEAAGLAAALNGAVGQAPGHDVAVVLAPCELPEGGLARVQAAAHADDTVGAACALVAGASAPMFPGFDGDPVLDADAPAPRLAGDPLHPRLFTLRGPCVVIRGSTLQLLAPLPDALATPARALSELSARIVAAGLSCVVADDVVVRGADNALTAPDGPGDSDGDGWRAAVRGLDDALEIGPLRRALVAARSLGRRARSVTIDGRGLGPGASGTQTYMAGLVLALARDASIEVRLAVRRNAAPELLARFRDAGVGIDVLGPGDALPAGHRHTDIAHRPQQAFVAEDLRTLQALGERIVISHLDLIAYRNPTYHADAADWTRYRAVTRLALSAADAVLFFSAHARDDATAEELVEPRRAALAGVGIDDPPTADAPASTRPAGLTADGPLLVMIGADYRHKNRAFALRVLDELVGAHGWDGTLVLAGAHVPHGSSAPEESALLAQRPALGARVVDLGPVTDDERRWLLDHATALCAPSLYEGFGLVPLEAARAGVPCLYAPVTSMTEVVGSSLATVVPWDPAASAAAAMTLLRPGPDRDRHVAALREALDRWRWNDVAARVRAAYDQALAMPYRPSAPRAFAELQREELIVALERARLALEERVDYGLALIDAQGPLLSRAQQHGLMRIAARPWLRTALLGPVGLLGALGSELGSPSATGDDAVADRGGR